VLIPDATDILKLTGRLNPHRIFHENCGNDAVAATHLLLTQPYHVSWGVAFLHIVITSAAMVVITRILGWAAANSSLVRVEVESLKNQFSFGIGRQKLLILSPKELPDKCLKYRSSCFRIFAAIFEKYWWKVTL
jgi:hypothetical protein